MIDDSVCACVCVFRSYSKAAKFPNKRSNRWIESKAKNVLLRTLLSGTDVPITSQVASSAAVAPSLGRVRSSGGAPPAIVTSATGRTAAAASAKSAAPSAAGSAWLPVDSMPARAQGESMCISSCSCAVCSLLHFVGYLVVFVRLIGNVRFRCMR